MANRIVQTDYAPAAIGPYSQGAFTQIALYCSGQLGIDPATENWLTALKNKQRRPSRICVQSSRKPVSRWPISSK